MLKLTLEMSGYVVDVARDGIAALEALDQQRPCLVILDLVMPELDGWGVLAQMKARKLDDIPVCVISALSERTPSDVVASLRKPFDTNELLAVASRYCPQGHAPT